MPIDRTAQVRSHILDQLEAGRLSAGDRVPAARDLAEHLGISFLKVQQAMETLAQDGILEIRPRVGAFVHATDTGDARREDVEELREATLRAGERHLIGLREVGDDVGDVPALARRRAAPAGRVEPAEQRVELPVLLLQRCEHPLHAHLPCSGGTYDRLRPGST